jgi:hypothetical protein
VGNREKANEIEDRLIDFAVRVIKMADALPRTPAGKHIAVQLLRAGTSPAPNYAEARGGKQRGLCAQNEDCVEGTERDLRMAPDDLPCWLDESRATGRSH